MEAKKPLRTFLSYSRVNQQFAIRLACELKSAGYSVWMDQFDIPTGARWDDAIENALRDCEIFMFIMTPASIESENAKDEVGYAIDHGKHILPVLFEECDVPLRLRRLQYVDFTKKNFNEGIKSAKELLSNLVGNNAISQTQTGNLGSADLSQGGPIPSTKEPKTVPTSHIMPYIPATKKKQPSKWVFLGAGIVLLGGLITAGLLLGPQLFATPLTATPTQVPSSTYTSVPTNTSEPPTETTYTQTPNGLRSFTEKFDENSRWTQDWILKFRHGDAKKESNFGRNITDGGLKLTLTHEFIWGYFLYDPTVIFSDIQLEVIVEDLRSTDTLALICQYSELGWYEFDINGGGEYSLRYVDNMESGSDEARYLLKNGTIPGFRYSIVETSENTFQIECNNDQLTLHANGIEIFNDYTNSMYKLEKGQIGIAARSYESYPVQFTVKSITVREP